MTKSKPTTQISKPRRKPSPVRKFFREHGAMVSHVAIIVLMFVLAVLVPSPVGHAIEFGIAVRAINRVFRRSQPPELAAPP